MAALQFDSWDWPLDSLDWAPEVDSGRLGSTQVGFIVAAIATSLEDGDAFDSARMHPDGSSSSTASRTAPTRPTRRYVRLASSNNQDAHSGGRAQIVLLSDRLLSSSLPTSPLPTHVGP